MSSVLENLAPTHNVVFDAGLLRRLDRNGPRYTSYPTADRFTADFGAADYRRAVARHRELGQRHALSMYVHLPFCESICYYCACNKIVSRNHGQTEAYLARLIRELALHADLLAGSQDQHTQPQHRSLQPAQQSLDQLHFGGGTPTYFDDDQLGRLMQAIARHFPFTASGSGHQNEGEFSIEVDPRTVDAARVMRLRELGFNRISFGVQDFDPVVQRAVHREQSVEQTQTLVEAARRAGFRSVSIDLIYGLPHQNVISFNRTLHQVLALKPDRIAVYGYAHMPHLFKPQRRIDPSTLPTSEQKLDLLALCIRRCTQAGFVYIGMDHFARSTDSLAVAQRQGRLHRNFQGYSTHAEAALIGLGVSAIGAVGSSYSQNAKTMHDWSAMIDAGQLPIVRGVTLGREDLLRRTVIHTLLCQGELGKRSIEVAFDIEFDQHFAEELQALEQLADDGLVELNHEWITVTPRGRLLLRNVVMPFDRYLQSSGAAQRHSRVI